MRCSAARRSDYLFAMHETTIPAEVMDASGLMIWMGDTAGADLRPEHSGMNEPPSPVIRLGARS